MQATYKLQQHKKNENIDLLHSSSFVLPFPVPLTLSLLLFDLKEPSVELVAETAASLAFSSK